MSQKGILKKRPRDEEDDQNQALAKKPKYPVLDYHVHPENYPWRWQNRSTKQIVKSDLARLLKLAWQDYRDFVKRNPQHQNTEDRLLAICLCQGAALHYCNRTNGIRDFDIYFFFKKPDPSKFPTQHPFPTSRKGNMDFGRSKFGKTDHDNCPKFQNYQGRIIDIFGRDLPYDEEYPDPTYCQTIKRYLTEEKTPTAHYLAQKAVVVLYPERDMGTVIWHNQDYQNPYTHLINAQKQSKKTIKENKPK